MEILVATTLNTPVDEWIQKQVKEPKTRWIDLKRVELSRETKYDGDKPSMTYGVTPDDRTRQKRANLPLYQSSRETAPHVGCS